MCIRDSFYTNGPRWNYYRARAEGHNTLVINPSADLDQAFQAGKFSPIVKAESKPKGAYQVLDMTQAYSNRPEVLSARRGYMLADNRRSFVLRDEIKVNKQSEIYWFMHTKAQVELLDSHTALLTQNGQTMKFEFLSDTSNAELSVMDAAPLPTSPQPQGQNKNNGYRKLAIRLSGTGSLNISVRMTPYFEKAAQTPFTCSPIDGWTLPDGEIPPMPSAEMIYIDGLPLEGFSPTHGSYRFDVPDQQEELPSVTIQAEGKTIERYETGDGVRFEISDPSEPGQVRIYNVQLHVSPIRDYQKLVPASVKASAVPEPENVPENVADGNLDTRWAAQETQWIELDLGEAQSFDKIALAWMNGNERHYKFKLLVSVDGKSYQPVYEGHSSGGSNDYELYACPGTTARYIRYEGSGSDVSTWNSVTEFWALKSN